MGQTNRKERKREEKKREEKKREKEMMRCNVIAASLENF